MNQLDTSPSAEEDWYIDSLYNPHTATQLARKRLDYNAAPGMVPNV